MVQPLCPAELKDRRGGAAFTEIMSNTPNTPNVPNVPPRRIFWAMLLERNPIGTCVSSVIDLAAEAGRLGYERLAVPYGRADSARNALCDLFLERSANPHDTLIMLDDDHVHHPKTLERLASADEMVVGALAFRRGKPYDPIAFVRSPKDGELHAMSSWEPGQLYKVDLVSPAAIAVQRRAFGHLRAEGFQPPWWRYTYADGSAALPSEDMYFARCCEKAGVPHHVDTGLIAPHHADGWVDETVWREYALDHPEAVKAPRVSVVIPTRHRAEGLARSLQSLLATTQGFEVEPVVVADLDDGETLARFRASDAPWKVVVNPDPELTGIPKWNLGAAASTGDWLVTGADDVVWQPGWLQAALNSRHSGFVGLNDGRTDPQKFSTHYMLTRGLAIDLLGGVLQVPAYRAWYSDIEVCERMRRAGRYVTAPEPSLEHAHPALGTGPRDELHERAQVFYAADKDTFERRRREGFPTDYAGVIRALPREAVGAEGGAPEATTGAVAA